MDEKNDLLVDETVTEILWRFDVPHAFPPEHAYIHGGSDDKVKLGFWKRLCRAIAACFGIRRAAIPSLRDQQGTDEEGSGRPGV